MAKRNLFDLLREDHRNVDHLFKQMEKTKDLFKQEEIFADAAIELIVHSEAEDEVIYSKLERKSLGKERVEQSRLEHAYIKKLVSQLGAMTCDDAHWQPMFRKLVIAVLNHIDEEEAESFELLERHFDQMQLAKMAEDFLARKEEIKEKKSAA